MCEPINQSIETLDVEGDVIVVAQGNSPDIKRWFLVSTKVLGLASPVFLKLFGPQFLEGQQLAKYYRPEIALYDDDPAALGVILSVLHHQKPEEMSKMSTKELATLAIHCDKYDCTKPLWPWAYMWLCQFSMFDLTPEGLGNLLLTAYLFRDSQQCNELTKVAQLILPVQYSIVWGRSGILDKLPDAFIVELSRRIEELHDTIQYRMYYVECLLRCCEEGYLIPGMVECKLCGRTHPDVTETCQPCENSDLQPKYCTRDSRISQLFCAIMDSFLSPPLKLSQTLPVLEISRLIKSLKKVEHSCAAGEACPLKVELKNLTRVIHQVVKQVEGIPFFDNHT